MTDMETAFEALQKIRGSLKEEFKWRSAGPIRDATALAILPLALQGQVDYAQIRHAAQHLKDNHNKLYFLKSAVRYSIAASLLGSDVNPATFTNRLSEARQLWKDLKLRRGSPYEGVCLFLLLTTGGKSADRGTLATLKSSFDRLNEEHYWYVGTYTMVALTLALQFNGSAATEATVLFSELKQRKFKGTDMMSASLVATLARRPPVESAGWMKGFQDEMRYRKMRSASIMGSSVALPLLTKRDPSDYAALVETYKNKLRAGPFKSSPSQSLALNFVNMGSIMEEGDRISGQEAASITSIVSALQAYIAVQQQTAAMVAVTAGAGAATAS